MSAKIAMDTSAPNKPVIIHGWGNMGSAIGEGLLKANPQENLTVIIREPKIELYDNDQKLFEEKLALYKKRVAHLNELKETHPNLHVFENANEAQTDLVNARAYIPSVKPQGSIQPLKDASQYLAKDAVIASPMAGVKTSYFYKFFDQSQPISLMMPNLASGVGESMTGFWFNDNVSNEQKRIVQDVVKTIGHGLEVNQEAKIDAITAVSGSGPGYYFYFLEWCEQNNKDVSEELPHFEAAMIKGAKDLGFSEQDATTLVQQTITGAQKRLEASDLRPAEWRKKVSSKGGTTLAGLKKMIDAGKDFYGAILIGMQAACTRGGELNDEQLDKLKSHSVNDTTHTIRAAKAPQDEPT